MQDFPSCCSSHCSLPFPAWASLPHCSSSLSLLFLIHICPLKTGSKATVFMRAFLIYLK